MARPALPTSRRRRAVRSATVLAAGVVVTVLLVTGCAATTTPVPDGSLSTGSTASPSPTSAPTLVADGSAAQNLPVFAQVTATVWASPDQVSGRAYIDALVAAGFDKTAMQVTSDTTTIGNPAESIQFSVHWHDGQCLVGQVGPATGAPVTAVLPGLATGGCLLGATRAIDW